MSDVQTRLGMIMGKKLYDQVSFSDIASTPLLMGEDSLLSAVVGLGTAASHLPEAARHSPIHRYGEDADFFIAPVSEGPTAPNSAEATPNGATVSNPAAGIDAASFGLAQALSKHPGNSSHSAAVSDHGVAENVAASGQLAYGSGTSGTTTTTTSSAITGSSQTTTTVSATGNPYIDGLLIGTKWAGPVTYSFPDSPTDYSGGSYEANDPSFHQVS